MKRFWIPVLCLLGLLCGCHSDLPSPAPTTPSALESTGLPSTIPQTDPTKAPEIETTLPEITEPQLYIEFTREGITERIPVKDATGTVGHYTIGYDPERFTQDGDVFRDSLWGGTAPIVYYAVTYYPDLTAQELVSGLILQNEGDYASYETEATTVGQYEATGVYFSGDDTLMHFFAIDSPYGGSYLLETQFGVEMYEGLYPQIRAALDTFVIME